MSLPEPLTLPAHELARLVRTRALSPVTLTELHIRRLEEVNPAINALAEDRFEKAMDEARAAEEALAHTPVDELPPLHGVPCSIKEFVAVEGMPWTGGLWCRREIRAPEDAPTVARLRRAGAIVMGVTNAPEGGLWMETHNPLRGRTRNPWDLNRTSGGSSGGEAAVAAVAGAPFGVGSDVGGSIRIPAAFCGVFGHKPSGGFVPNTGHWPPAGPRADRYLSTGPMGRSVEDLKLLLGLMADHPVPTVAPPKRVFLLPHSPSALCTRTERELAAAVDRAGEALAAAGAEVQPLDAPRWRYAFEIWSAMLSAGSDESYSELLTGGGHLSPVREALRFVMGRSRHTGPAITLVAAEAVVDALPGRVDRMLAEGAALRDELTELLGDDGVILHPPYTRPAPRHHGPWFTPLDVACTAIFNVLEFAVTQVPAGLSRKGLPLGVQVAAPNGRDALTLAAARVLEQELGGWQPCLRTAASGRRP